MQKTKLWPEIKNHFGIDSSHKIPPPFVTRKLRQNRRKTIISRDTCKKTKLCSEIKNHLGIDTSHKIPPPLVTRKYHQNRRKSIISRDICKKRNYGPKSKTF